MDNRITGTLPAMSYPGKLAHQDIIQNLYPVVENTYERERGTVSKKYVVRRLTPLECERLQGFPDDWTNLGEWIDSKGKKHKDADSPRYRALGNSIARPYWDWLLGNISQVIREESGEIPLMASLFDGIGGFPLSWERINGNGTCRWASEIEEFPIAVTSLRFPEP